MFTTQLQRLGFQVTQGLELLKDAMTSFEYKGHLISFHLDGKGIPTVYAYCKMDNRLPWAESNMMPLTSCNKIEDATAFIDGGKIVKVDTHRQRFYSVTANWDKIQKYPQFCGYNFQTIGPRCPNQATVHLSSKESAQELFDAMKALDIIAFKDWLD